jgi:ribonucleoside-diphosphate reductase alpha chain
LISKIRKRDGRIEPFDRQKIANALEKAFLSVGKSSRQTVERLTSEVVATLNQRYPHGIPSVENVQDLVENALIKNGFSDVAKAYILYRREHADIRDYKKLVGVKDDLKLGVNAIKVLERRYLKKDSKGTAVETPSQLFRRVARTIAKADSKYDSSANVQEAEELFYGMMSSLEFLPNSPTLMNAGTKLGQLSACFVIPIEDDLSSIFDAVKATALIHQSGGGCVSGNSYVYTDFCGIERFAKLYERVRSAGMSEDVNGDYAVMEVKDLGIRTMSFDKEHGRYKPTQVTHLWRYNVPLSDQVRIRTAKGIEVTTSCWHPFLVFDGRCFIERRADELRAGDILPTPNDSIRQNWPHTEYHFVGTTLLDEEIAWLLGYYLGDGSLGWAKIPKSKPRRLRLRWRLFDGRMETLEYARTVLAQRFDVHIRIQKDSRGLYSLTTTSSKFIEQFCSLVNVHPGPKLELPFPEMVVKSPLSVVGAFLAGLIDSDGHVDRNRGRVTFATQSRCLAEKTLALCSLLGLSPTMRAREPHGRGKARIFEVKFAAEPFTSELRNLIGKFLHDPLKFERLVKTRWNHEGSTNVRLPIHFSAIEDVLQNSGIATRSTKIHRQAILIGETKLWFHRWKQGFGINSAKLLNIVKALRLVAPKQFQARLDILENLARGATTVKSVETPSKKEQFYDLTVTENPTYLAGSNGLTVVHNTGYSFSKLRPHGDYVKTSGGVASGPVSFMKVFNAATEEIKQGGRRRGANMGILSVYHPDIMEFITAKSGPGSLQNFNISVAADDNFMRAAIKGAKINLVNPRNGQITSGVSAAEIFQMIVSKAWETGDPGLIFTDAINRANPTPKVGMIEATNPCGEQPLLPYESCNLGSINLTKFVAGGEISWGKLGSAVRNAVHFLDNVIDANRYPMRQITRITLANRKIGLGVMGFAEMLIMLKVKYDSNDAVNTARRLMRFIQKTSHEASEELARSRGSFPNFKQSTWRARGYKRMRNATVTTIAPTGTISIIADCSSGIEPLFAVCYVRDVMEGTKLLETNPLFEEIARKRGFFSTDLLSKIAETGSVQNLNQIPRDVRDLFVTALDIAPDWHVRIQAAFQESTDNAVSKTINLPNNATIEDVKRSYLLAWRLKCKGITVYRYGSKANQVLYIGALEKEGGERHVVADSEYAGGCAGTTCPY